MNMSFSNKYIAAVAALALLAVTNQSCKKYLNTTPVSSFGPDYVFSNVSNATTAVLGAYQAMTGDNAYGVRLSMYYTYDNDEMMGQGATPYPDNDRRDIAHYNTQPSNTQLALPFNQLYSGVERANLCIYYIPKMDLYTKGDTLTQKQLRRLYGESLTLRAQFYLELVRNWGDVPAQFEPSFTQTDLFKTKTDRDTIYNHILNDLLLAETLVPWRTEAGTSNERITQGAVRALRARIALFRAGYSLRRTGQMARSSDYMSFYQIAMDEAKVVMDHTSDHSLNPSFQSVFKDAICANTIEPNGEVIWEVAFGGSSGSSDSKLGYYNGPKVGNTGNAALTILLPYFYQFDSNDKRRDVTIAPYDVNADATLTGRPGYKLVDGKFRRDWMGATAMSSGAQYFGLNWPLIRLSDVMLMYAEASNEINGGANGDAVTAFEKVRKRGYGANASLIGTTPTDHDGFFNAIVKERSLELGGEGIRKYDLIRWNLLKTKLDYVKSVMAAMAAQTAPWDQYPKYMYCKTTSTTMVWANSFYQPAVSSTAPTDYTALKWMGTSNITNSILTYFAVGFTPNHSELLPLPQAAIDANPNLTQDYGY